MEIDRQNPHLFSAFSQSCLANTSQIALVVQEDHTFQELTYHDIHERVCQFGAYLKNQGIGPDDKVAIFLENGLDFFVAFFGIMFADATAVLLDIQYTTAQVKNLVLHSEARAIVLGEKNRERIAHELHSVKIVPIDADAHRRDIHAAKPQNFEASPREEHVAVLFYTSGTTDAPKAVMLTHENLLSNVDSIRQLKVLQSTDRVISFLPLHHAYAFTVTLLTPIILGAAVVYPKTLSATELLRCVRESKTTIFVGVPRVFELMCKSIKDRFKALPGDERLAAEFLGSCGGMIDEIFGTGINKRIFAAIHQTFGKQLRFMVSGGAKLEPEVALAFTYWGFKILEGYGLTETSPVATFTSPQRPVLGSVGKPLAGVQVRIDNPNKDGIGEVAIKGPNVMAGYYRMSRETAEAVRDGWFYSGDLGYINREGYLFLAGRRKEIIILSNGENLHPEEIERHYNQNAFVKEVGILANKDQYGTEQLVAVVVPNDDRLRAKQVTNIREKLKWELENLSSKLPTYKRIRGFAISQEALPRTRLGKLKRFKLNEIYDKLDEPVKQVAPEGEGEVDGDYSGFSNSALAYLEETIKRPIRLKDHLELDLGLDSLSRIELLISLQERLQLNLEGEQSMEFFMCNTVEELLEKLKQFVPQLVNQFKKEKSFDWNKHLNEPLQPATQKKIKIDFGPLAIAFNVVMIALFKLFFKIFFLLKTEGRVHLPLQGGFLVCPNHTSYLDGMFILCALPFKLTLQTYFVGYSSFFESPVLKSFIRIARLIPMATNMNLVEALKASAFVLRKRKIVCYFPEGQRSIDGSLNPFKKGVGILISELNVPVVPVYLSGAIKTWGRSQRTPRLARVTVKFGAPQTPEALAGKDAAASPEERYTVIANNLREEVARLAS